jgi:hypothetical protein
VLRGPLDVKLMSARTAGGTKTVWTETVCVPVSVLWRAIESERMVTAEVKDASRKSKCLSSLPLPRTKEGRAFLAALAVDALDDQTRYLP